MALRPNVLTDAALHIAFEASILLQFTDINLYELERQASNRLISDQILALFYVRIIEGAR